MFLAAVLTAHPAPPQQDPIVSPFPDVILDRCIVGFRTNQPAEPYQAALSELERKNDAYSTIGEAARFFNARFNQREYERSGTVKKLDKAIGNYRDLISEYERSKRPWQSTRLSDVRFYKAIAFMEKGDWQSAFDAINDLKPDKDKEIEVDFAAWTSNSRFHVYEGKVICPASELRKEFLDLFETYTGLSQKQPKLNLGLTNKKFDANVFESIVAGLTSKCRAYAKAPQPQQKK